MCIHGWNVSRRRVLDGLEHSVFPARWMRLRYLSDYRMQPHSVTSLRIGRVL